MTNLQLNEEEVTILLNVLQFHAKWVSRAVDAPGLEDLSPRLKEMCDNEVKVCNALISKIAAEVMQ